MKPAFAQTAGHLSRTLEIPLRTILRALGGMTALSLQLLPG